jgi:DMSO/TMAO reductase YedYZ molybdopterin-dependent catalytic subunit
MDFVTRGFQGRPRGRDERLPPGQYLTDDFPVLSAGPTSNVDHDEWELWVATEDGTRHTWSWQELMALPAETVTVDIHCVTSWSKLGTTWRGVSLDKLLDAVDTDAPYLLAGCYGGYTTNLPTDEVRGGKAWIAFEFDGQPLHPEHGGPARLLVPHLYLWKSAKWVNSIRMLERDQAGFWESLGYSMHGDPWREERYRAV